MNIALVTPQWSGTTGGPSNYTAALDHELRRLGHSVSVITTDFGSGAIPIRGGTPLRDWRLFEALRAVRPDIVHLHGRAHFIPAALLYRRLFPAARIVFTFHTQPFVGRFIPSIHTGKPDYNTISRVIVSALLRRCDVVTTVSESIIRNLNAFYSLDIRQFETVPSGGYPGLVNSVEVQEFRSLHGLDDHFPVLASVGVFSWEWKVAGHQLCIDAVSELIARYPRVLLMIAGDGQHRGYLQEHARLRGVNQQVRFLGNVPNPGMVLGAADLYLHMAMNEGCSLALIEAMLAGKSIIAARLGGTPEILEDRISARLIEANAHFLASTVIELLLDEKMRAAIARGAHTKATRSLTWAHVAHQYETVYAKTLSPRQILEG